LWLRLKGTFTNTFNSPHFGPPPTNVVVVRHRAKAWKLGNHAGRLFAAEFLTVRSGTMLRGYKGILGGGQLFEVSDKGVEAFCIQPCTTGIQ
jgi:hypothetical protein